MGFYEVTYKMLCVYEDVQTPQEEGAGPCQDFDRARFPEVRISAAETIISRMCNCLFEFFHIYSCSDFKAKGNIKA